MAHATCQSWKPTNWHMYLNHENFYFFIFLFFFFFEIQPTSQIYIWSIIVSFQTYPIPLTDFDACF